MQRRGSIRYRRSRRGHRLRRWDLQVRTAERGRWWTHILENAERAVHTCAIDRAGFEGLGVRYCDTNGQTEDKEGLDRNHYV